MGRVKMEKAQGYKSEGQGHKNYGQGHKMLKKKVKIKSSGKNQSYRQLNCCQAKMQKASCSE